MPATNKWSQTLSFIWGIRDEILRYHYERHQVGDVILPLVVLRRLDLVLLPTKDKVVNKSATLTGSLDSHYDLLCHQSKHAFYNTSRFTFDSLVTTDPEAIRDNFLDYLNGFSPNVRDIIGKFGFQPEVDHMDEVGILLRVLGKFTNPAMDLSPSHMSNMDMGYLYEELLRLSADLSNKEAGDHFTPREVIRLMVSLLVADTKDVHKPGRVFTVYDPTCGTGGMLTETENRLLELNPEARVHLFGQELLKKSYAVCASDMLIKGQEGSNIAFGDTLANDAFHERRFDYVVANPPYGADWSESMTHVKREHARGFAGRFGAGLPTKNDGQLLFLQHMIAKAKTADEGGGRVAVVLNGSPLFSGDAGSGESNIRTWMFENDLVEAIIGLPDQMFYNTGINTYIWLLSTDKAAERRGLVQLIDARGKYAKMAKSLGDKRNELLDHHIQEIISLHDAFIEQPGSKILPNEAFGFTKVAIERPKRAIYALTDEARRRIFESTPFRRLQDAVKEPLEIALTGTPDWEEPSRAGAEARIESMVEGIERVPNAVRTLLLKSVTQLNAEGEIVRDAAGSPIADPSLREHESIPLGIDADDFLLREVLSIDSNSWANRQSDKLGFSVPFARLFYEYVPPRTLEEIDRDIAKRVDGVIALIKEATR